MTLDRAPAPPLADWRAPALALSVLLVALPFLGVTIPPSTDLPQHLAQVRILGEVFSGSTLYRFQPLVPYTTVYALFGLLWELVPKSVLPRVAALALALCWVVAIHALAKARNRSPAAAVLASAFAFSHLLYWGFASFAMGFPIFVLWLHLTRARKEPPGLREALGLTAGALALYLTHALWFAMGMAWLGLQALLVQREPRRWLWRGLGVAPVLAGAAYWYPHYAQRAAREFDVSMGFGVWTERLTPAWWVDASLGGLRGLAEPLFLAALLAVLVVVVRRKRGTVDRELLLAAALLLVSAFLLPDHYLNTVRFAQRYVPAGWVLLALALPAAERPTRRSVAMAGAGLALFTLVVGASWRRFEAQELEGFGPALAALPERPRVLGIDELPESRIVRGKPFLQLHAYAQVIKGGTLNDSFADYPHFPVVYRDTAHPWTQGLEEDPAPLQASDLAYFDHVLVQASPERQAALAARWGLVPLSPEGRWRAYRITR